MRRTIEVWICPTPECSNFYGSSSQVGLNLEAEPTYEADTNRQLGVGSKPITGYRADCPDCKQAGRGTIPRVKHLLVVEVAEPGIGQRPTASPESFGVQPNPGPDNSDAT